MKCFAMTWSREHSPTVFISTQSGLDLPVQLVLGPDANDNSVADVYVSCFGDDSVRRFDVISGLPIDDGYSSALARVD